MYKTHRIQHKILDWYDQNGRSLPWRLTKEPYPIWLSEIIMQQTRIEQGTPYYHRFIETYPTVFDLANAPEQDVLRLWQGLGYYSRARNMHHTAKAIAEQYQGIFPSDYSKLIKLKGIGDYTACEILSVCFNKAFAVLDGNVFRVLSRLYGIYELIDSAKGKKHVKVEANKLLDQYRPGDFNQAMMDLGAIVCTPKKPDCINCPIREDCIAFRENTQSDLPLKSASKKLKKRYLHYFLIQQENGIYIRKRIEKDIWQNLYDLPGIEKDNKSKITAKEVEGYLGQKPGRIKLIQEVKHILSHQELYIYYYRVEGNFSAFPLNINWIYMGELDHFPLPKPISSFLRFVFT